MDAQFFGAETINTLVHSLTRSASEQQLSDDSPKPSMSQSYSEQQSNLQGVVILEQSARFSLVRETATGLYYLCDAKTLRPFLKADHWAEAYRGWLNCRHQFPEASPISTALLPEALHDWVSQHQNDAYFGQLLYSCDRQFHGTLKYLVRLSETVAMCWTPTTGHSVSLGMLTIEMLGQRRHRSSKWVEPRSSDSISDALHRSIQALHHRYRYDLYQFNSEHWARLITTGQSCCFQKDDLYAYWLNHLQPDDRYNSLDIREENLEAQALLLLANQPKDGWS